MCRGHLVRGRVPRVEAGRVVSVLFNLVFLTLVSPLHHLIDGYKQKQTTIKHLNMNTLCCRTNPRCAKTFNKPFFNMSRFKTITLQIEGLNDKVR